MSLLTSPVDRALPKGAGWSSGNRLYAGGKIKLIMVEEAKRDPTVQEIVVALRETTFRGKGRGMAVVGRRPDDGEHAPALYAARSEDDDKPGAVEYKEAAFTDISELRDAEMQRLLAENARLNERVVFLLKVIEREQAARNERRDAESEPAREERQTIISEVKSALEAELRPVLLTVLRLLEQSQLGAGAQRAQMPAGSAAPAIERQPAPIVEREDDGRRDRPSDRRSAPRRTEDGGYHSGWILDLIRAVGGNPNVPRSGDAEWTPEPGVYRERGFIARVFERISSRHHNSHR